MLFRTIVRNVNECGDINSRQTLKDQFFDGEPVHLNLAGNLRMKICLCRRQSSDHFQELLPEVALRLPQFLFVADRLPGFHSLFVFLPRLLRLVLKERSYARPRRQRLFPHAESFCWRRILGGQRSEGGCSDQRGQDARSDDSCNWRPAKPLCPPFW